MSMWKATFGSTAFDPLDCTVNKQTDGVNTATVKIAAAFDVGTVVVIQYRFNNSYTTVLTGKVSKFSVDTVGLYSYDIVASEDEIRYFVAENSGNRVIIVDNSSHNKRITDYVTAILSGTGWTDGTANTSLYVPNSDPQEYLPSMRFANTYVSTALSKFLEYTCGYEIWYDSAAKKIYYGEYNVDRSATTIVPITMTRTKSDQKYGINRVIVYGKSGTQIVGIKSTGSAPYKTLMYRYADALDNDECEKIATQILNDRQYSLDRYVANIPRDANSGLYSEGDKVYIKYVPLAVDKAFGVKDVTHKMDTTVLGLGYPEVTIFDLLGSKLEEVTGSIETGTDTVFSGGWQNVGSGAPAKWVVNIADVDVIGSFIASVKLDKYKKQSEIDAANTDITLNNAYTGITLNSAYTGITISSAYTGASNQSATVGIALSFLNYIDTYYSTVDNGTSDVALTSGSWVQVSDGQTISANSAGHHFGIAFLTLAIQDTSGAGLSSVIAKLYRDGVGYITDAVPVISYCKGGTDYYLVTFVCPMLGTAYTGSMTFYWDVYAGQSGCTVKAWTSEIFIIPRHTHSYTDGGHQTGYNDPGHTTGKSDPGHSTGKTDPGHGTGKTDPGHDHDQSTNMSEVNSYPSSVKLKITNSDYTLKQIGATVSGGGAVSFDRDITSYLRDGENVITVESSTAGSVLLSGKLLLYGV